MGLIRAKGGLGIADEKLLFAVKHLLARGRRGLRVLTLLFSVLLLSGCSGLSFVYGLAENAIAGEAEFHLDLDEEEAARVEAAIDDLLDWHSRVMLPRYANYLGQQAQIIDRSALTEEQVAASVTELRVILGELVTGAAPFTASVLVDHTSPRKVSHLQARMAERLEERREELAEPANERLENRVERIVENIERITGDLTETQIRAVLRYAEETAGANEAWLQNRGNRQRVFLEFLSQEPNKAQISLFIEKILLRPHELVDPEYKAISDARWNRFQILIYEIFSSLTQEQRATASETLREYAAELLELSS